MKFNATAMLLFVVSSLAVATETNERNPAAVAERVAAVAVSPVKKAMVRSEGEFKLLDRSPRKPGGGGGVDEDEEDGDEEEVDEEEVDEEEVDEEEDEEEDAASTLALSYAALFAAVGAVAFSN